MTAMGDIGSQPVFGVLDQTLGCVASHWAGSSARCKLASGPGTGFTAVCDVPHRLQVDGTTLGTASVRQVVVLKLTTTGSLTWSMTCSGALSPVVATNADHILIAATTEGVTVDCQSSTGGSFSVPPANASQAESVMTMKLDSGGGHLWSHFYRGIGGPAALDAALHSNGRAVVVGRDLIERDPQLSGPFSGSERRGMAALSRPVTRRGVSRVVVLAVALSAACGSETDPTGGTVPTVDSDPIGALALVPRPVEVTGDEGHPSSRIHDAPRRSSPGAEPVRELLGQLLRAPTGFAFEPADTGPRRRHRPSVGAGCRRSRLVPRPTSS